MTRRNFLAASAIAAAPNALTLESTRLRLSFDGSDGTLGELQNKATGETYRVDGDEFEVDTADAHRRFSEFKLQNLDLSGRVLRLAYQAEQLRVEVNWTLGASDGFAEKKVWVIPDRPCALKNVVLSRPHFTTPGMEIVCYRHPDYARLEAQHHGRVRRPPGTEPIRTYFCRTPKGGAFTGVEMPFDSSSLDGRTVVLGYSPAVKVAAGERLACEPAYVGVYERSALDARASEWRPADAPPTAPLPLPSESSAMVAMTSAVLGPRRHPGLAAMACGWHCEMEHEEYASDQSMEGDMKSLDFLADCGVDWLTDSHPWGGETRKMNGLTGNQNYELSPRVRRFLEHARKAGVKVVQWPSMNNTHPWSRLGGPFRPDRPDWLRVPVSRPEKDFRNTKSNCIGNSALLAWLERIDFQAMDTGLYDGWCMDGDFWGWGGYFQTTIKAECTSDRHDHLPEDANYACQRALDRWIGAIRERYPKTFVVMCRPPMDLGVWSQRNVDACFTLIETGSGSSNIAGGDEIRIASRIRLHHHFFPHYIDWPLLFPSYSGMPGKRKKDPVWPSEKLDYILLSALSCAPNLLLYLPTKGGIPAKDKAELRKWLEWGRANIAYLNIRRDLPDWPANGKVDGSAHIVGDRGFVFLFNSGKQPLSGEFPLTAAALGIKRRATFRISQHHPQSARTARVRYGNTVRWEVPGETAVVLSVEGRA